MAVHRWRFIDPSSGDYYVFEHNPKEMTSPFPRRNITAQTTTAINGQVVLMEGNPGPAEWTFRGSIRSKAHYDALRSWVYDDQGRPRSRRIIILDHFGRQLEALLLSFNPTPKRALNVYWRHEYEMTALVTKVGLASVENAPVGVFR